MSCSHSDSLIGRYRHAMDCDEMRGGREGRQRGRPRICSFRYALRNMPRRTQRPRVAGRAAPTPPDDAQEDAGKLLARLTGFLAQPGYVPEDEDDWYFDVFDMRSQHAYHAFQVLVDAALIAKALKVDALSEEFSAIAIATACWSIPRCAVLALD